MINILLLLILLIPLGVSQNVHSTFWRRKQNVDFDDVSLPGFLSDYLYHSHVVSGFPDFGPSSNATMISSDLDGDGNKKIIIALPNNNDNAGSVYILFRNPVVEREQDFDVSAEENKMKLMVIHGESATPETLQCSFTIELANETPLPKPGSKPVNDGKMDISKSLKFKMRMERAADYMRNGDNDIDFTEDDEKIVLKEPLVRLGRSTIHCDDLPFFADGVCLSDPIMDYFIRKQFEDARLDANIHIYIMSTQFSCAMEAIDKSTMLNFSHVCDVYNSHYIILPIHRDFHWSLCVLIYPNTLKNIDSESICLFLDSLNYHNKAYWFGVITQWLLTDLETRRGFLEVGHYDIIKNNISDFGPSNNATMISSDLDGDGNKEIIIALPNNNDNAGSVYILFGNPVVEREQDFDVSAEENKMKLMVIHGESPGDLFGWSLSSDRNELGAGAPGTTFLDRVGTGKTYLLFNISRVTEMSASNLTAANAIVFGGKFADENSGYSVALASASCELSGTYCGEYTRGAPLLIGAPGRNVAYRLHAEYLFSLRSSQTLSEDPPVLVNLAGLANQPTLGEGDEEGEGGEEGLDGDWIVDMAVGSGGEASSQPFSMPSIVPSGQPLSFPDFAGLPADFAGLPALHPTEGTRLDFELDIVTPNDPPVASKLSPKDIEEDSPPPVTQGSLYFPGLGEGSEMLLDPVNNPDSENSNDEDKIEDTADNDGKEDDDEEEENEEEDNNEDNDDDVDSDNDDVLKDKSVYCVFELQSFHKLRAVEDRINNMGNLGSPFICNQKGCNSTIKVLLKTSCGENDKNESNSGFYLDRVLELFFTNILIFKFLLLCCKTWLQYRAYNKELKVHYGSIVWLTYTIYLSHNFNETVDEWDGDSTEERSIEAEQESGIGGIGGIYINTGEFVTEMTQIRGYLQKEMQKESIEVIDTELGFSDLVILFSEQASSRNDFTYWVLVIIALVVSSLLCLETRIRITEMLTQISGYLQEGMQWDLGTIEAINTELRFSGTLKYDPVILLSEQTSSRNDSTYWVLVIIALVDSSLLCLFIVWWWLCMDDDDNNGKCHPLKNQLQEL